MGAGGFHQRGDPVVAPTVADDRRNDHPVSSRMRREAWPTCGEKEAVVATP